MKEIPTLVHGDDSVFGWFLSQRRNTYSQISKVKLCLARRKEGEKSVLRIRIRFHLSEAWIRNTERNILKVQEGDDSVLGASSWSRYLLKVHEGDPGEGGEACLDVCGLSVLQQSLLEQERARLNQKTLKNRTFNILKRALAWCATLTLTHKNRQQRGIYS